MAAVAGAAPVAGPSSVHASPAVASTSGTSGSTSKNGQAGSSSLHLELTPQLMSSLKPAKVFREHVDKDHSYTSLAYDDRGERMVTCGDNGSLHLFDCRSGKHSKKIYSQKYGCHLARFTHSAENVIYASTKHNEDIRYQALRDNTYLKYFSGHKKRVVSIEMSPVDDTFLSGAEDDTVRLWDLRAKNCQGLLNVAGVPSVSYDPSGLIFAVTLNLKSTTLLYDIRKLDAEPFSSIAINDPILSRSYPMRIPISTSAKFSNDGNYILVGTSGNVHYVLHSFENKVVARLEGHQGLENHGQEVGSDFPPHAGISGEETTWSPDSRFIISGSNDGDVYIWDVNPPAGSEEARNRPPPGPECTLRPMKVLQGHKNSPSRVVKFNHRLGMLASGGIGELSFWLPDSSDPQSGLEHADAS